MQDDFNNNNIPIEAERIRQSVLESIKQDTDSSTRALEQVPDDIRNPMVPLHGNEDSTEQHLQIQEIDVQRNTLVQQEQGFEEEEEARAREFERARAEKKRTRRTRIDNILYDVSYYGYIASWVFLVMFIAGRFLPNVPIVTLAGVVGSLVSIASSISAAEIVDMRHRAVSTARCFVVSAGAVALAVTGLLGLATGNAEIMSAGVIGLFAWSFVPNLIDFTKRQGDDYNSYEYDDEGNVISGGEDDGSSYSYSSSGSSSGGYSVINEVFGIPQPQDPPPIEISRDDVDDEYADKHFLGVEVLLPQDPTGDVVIVPLSENREPQVGDDKPEAGIEDDCQTADNDSYQAEDGQNGNKDGE